MSTATDQGTVTEAPVADLTKVLARGPQPAGKLMAQHRTVQKRAAVRSKSPVSAEPAASARPRYWITDSDHGHL